MTLARAAAHSDALDAEDVARVDTRHAFICGYETARHDNAALEGLATNGSAQAYTTGYEAGQRDAAITHHRLCGRGIRFEGQSPLTCNLRAGHQGDCEFGQHESVTADPSSYTAAQLARSDALAAAAWVLNEFTLDDIAETLLDVARPLATWIEHGDPATPQT